jgi:flagellar P-ring protein precursor FlgI
MSKLRFILPALLIACLASSAHAVKVGDITRLGGQRVNKLTGLGLVIGLKGTGDGGDFQAAINPLASLLSKFADPVKAEDLSSAQNVAVVMVTVTLPPNGVRDGDRIDCYVRSVGAAKSLRGGSLFITPMQGPMPGSGIFALAEGPIVIEDPSTPTSGVVKLGCVMEADLPAKYIEDGRFTLILDDASASWTTASTIAKIINDAGDGNVGEILAVAVDPKNVVVTIPASERDLPDSFISRVQRLPVPMLASEARVQINERSGTLIITGDVEISPVVISHKGLTITTINPAPVPRPGAPVIEEKDFVALDTTNQGGGKLQDLVNALDQLKVPSEDRIAIVKELHKTGKLHAKLVVE